MACAVKLRCRVQDHGQERVELATQRKKEYVPHLVKELDRDLDALAKHVLDVVKQQPTEQGQILEPLGLCGACVYDSRFSTHLALTTRSLQAAWNETPT